MDVPVMRFIIFLSQASRRRAVATDRRQVSIADMLADRYQRGSGWTGLCSVILITSRACRVPSYVPRPTAEAHLEKQSEHPVHTWYLNGICIRIRYPDSKGVDLVVYAWCFLMRSSLSSLRSDLCPPEQNLQVLNNSSSLSALSLLISHLNTRLPPRFWLTADVVTRSETCAHDVDLQIKDRETPLGDEDPLKRFSNTSLTTARLYYHWDQYSYW